VKSLAGAFVYGHDANNPNPLPKMTGPAHSVEPAYPPPPRGQRMTSEPHRSLIAGVVSRTKSSIGILPMARAGTPELPPAARSLTKPGSLDGREGLKPSLQPAALPNSSYTCSNDLLGRRETNTLNQYPRISEDQRAFDDRVAMGKGRPAPASPSIAVTYNLDGKDAKGNRERIPYFFLSHRPTAAPSQRFVGSKYFSTISRVTRPVVSRLSALSLSIVSAGVCQWG
jgi:hypothetical protein